MMNFARHSSLIVSMNRLQTEKHQHVEIMDSLGCHRFHREEITAPQRLTVPIEEVCPRVRCAIRDRESRTKSGYTLQNCTHFSPNAGFLRLNALSRNPMKTGIRRVSATYPQCVMALRNRRLEVRILWGVLTKPCIARLCVVEGEGHFRFDLAILKNPQICTVPVRYDRRRGQRTRSERQIAEPEPQGMSSDALGLVEGFESLDQSGHI